MSNKTPHAKPNHEETYDEWFLRQVEEAIAEADSPDAVWIPHEEVMAQVAARRERLLAMVPSATVTGSEHDAWFRGEVQKTLEGLRNGSVALIPEEEHDRRWQKRRSDLLTASRKSE